MVKTTGKDAGVFSILIGRLAIKYGKTIPQKKLPSASTWGKLYGDAPYKTPSGKYVWMLRKEQKVRFFDRLGNQIGPEQRNVAPACAYADSKHWSF